MATRKVTLTGKAHWAKVFPENRDMKGFEGAYEECDGAYTIEVALEKDQLDKLKAAKSAKKPVLKDDGTLRIKFVRKHKDKFDWAGGPPKVVDSDDDPWDFDSNGFIPNDSEVEVLVSVYDTSYRPGTRLEEVKVLEVAKMEDGVPF